MNAISTLNFEDDNDNIQLNPLPLGRSILLLNIFFIKRLLVLTRSPIGGEAEADVLATLGWSVHPQLENEGNSDLAYPPPPPGKMRLQL